MEIIVSDSYDEMSRQCAEAFMQLIKQYRRPLICPASGDSPAGLYAQLVQKVHANQLDVNEWFFVGLDEWAGMNGTDQGSCRYHLNNQLFTPLKVKAEKICFFDGRADLDKEGNKAEKFIDTHGGIDVAIVGLGINGHIGMNEPGTPASLNVHVADIAPVTQQTGQKYFKEARVLTRGITLGMATIMKARHVILVVNGKHKAEIVQQVLEHNISEALPATLLRNHPGFSVYLDKEAASLLHS